MRLELGINTCFAVKRWPLAADWAPIVRDRLGLGLVEHSFDLVDLAGGSIPAQAVEVTAAARQFGLTIRSTFTGLAAYSSNLLLSPNPDERAHAQEWFGRAIVFSEGVGAVATGGHVGAFSVNDWNDPVRRPERWEGCARPSISWLRRRAPTVSRRSWSRTWPRPRALDHCDDPGPLDRRRRRPRSDPPGLDVGHMC